MHFLYILYSKKTDRYYIGETSDIRNRLKQHQQHHFKYNFTEKAEDWELKLQFETTNREEALYLEKFIKRMKSKILISKVIQNLSLLSDILNKKQPWFPRCLGAGGTTFKNPLQLKRVFLFPYFSHSYLMM
ncbi:GIY-YIG nuclease family protein [Salegentibacter chungangensis]|uniref:GIY-YIG nuclease family protein n=1 Tax=Salegentibacter chungangensis TaxID=1335724 RepID=A0ABW3NKS1_9FLAO